MDFSRKPDLDRLFRTFNDFNKPITVRHTAYEAYKNILKQYKDRRLAELRLRLIRAIRANDHTFARKIEQVIIVYSRQKGYKV